MTWVILSALSALCLGVYDLLKKSAVRDNAVLPVLFFGVLTGAIIWLPFIVWSGVSPDTLPHPLLFVRRLLPVEHGWLMGKSLLVACSWLFGYFALKHLPLSTAGPIRSTGPLWTILIAVSFFGELPSSRQWLGLAILLASFHAFSFVGKLEGLHFRRNRWVWCMVAATFLGATSSLYDKFLLQRVGLSPSAVQAWFSVYLVVVLLPVYLLWKRGVWARGDFQWRWSIPLIGVTLLAADIFYFTAVQDQSALISVISPIRRLSVIVTFFGGVVLFGERTRVRSKALCLGVMLLGAYTLSSPGQ